MDKGEDCMSFWWSCHVCRWKENQPKGQSCHGRTLWRFGNREAKTVSLWQAKSGEGIMSRTQKMYAGSLSLTCEHVHHFSLEALRQSWSFRVRFFKRIGHDHGWSLLKQDLLHQTYQCFVTQCAMKILIVSSLAESWGKWFDVLIPRISPSPQNQKSEGTRPPQCVVTSRRKQTTRGFRPSFAVLTMRATYCSGREMITARQTQQQRKLPAIINFNYLFRSYCKSKHKLQW